jgi:hypothetical protein
LCFACRRGGESTCPSFFLILLRDFNEPVVNRTTPDHTIAMPNSLNNRTTQSHCLVSRLSFVMSLLLASLHHSGALARARARPGTQAPRHPGTQASRQSGSSAPLHVQNGGGEDISDSSTHPTFRWLGQSACEVQIEHRLERLAFWANQARRSEELS